MFRVVQCCKHLVGEGLKLEVRAAVERMMDMHLRAGARSLGNNLRSIVWVLSPETAGEGAGSGGPIDSGSHEGGRRG